MTWRVRCGAALGGRVGVMVVSPTRNDPAARPRSSLAPRPYGSSRTRSRSRRSAPYPARNSVPDAGLSDVLTPRRQGVFLRLYSSTAGAIRTASLAFCSSESGGAKWASLRRYSSRRCLYLSSRCCPASVISRLAIRSRAPGRSRPAGSSMKKQTRIARSRCTSRRTGAARRSAAVQAAGERRHPRGIPALAPLGDPPWCRLRAWHRSYGTVPPPGGPAARAARPRTRPP